MPDLVDSDARLGIELYLDSAILGDHVPSCGAFGVPPNIAYCGNGRRHGSCDSGP